MQLSSSQIAAYQRDGYLIVRQLFSKPEIEKLYQTALQDDAMKKKRIRSQRSDWEENQIVIVVYAWQ